jgi:NAD(P)-dependent dehydrogenase (short-subunit alcohol dehydrogenase family)
MTTAQAPIGSGFGAASTAEAVIRNIDLTGKTVIVTGGYSGIGLEAARVFSEAGAKVIVPARDTEKAERALSPLPGVELEKLDLMDPAPIDAFAERFLATARPLHILLNNAAVMMNPLTRDARGYESQFSTNHLGHFQLTARLWPALRQAHGARVVAVSSRGHTFSDVDFDDPNFERRPYDPRIAYGQAKTANALFAIGVDARGKADGIRSFSLHPGGILATALARHLPAEAIKASGYLDENGDFVIDPERNMKTIPQGAATSVWCATNQQLDGIGGIYCENCDIAKAVPADSEELLGVRPWATDVGFADRLWSLSEKLTGVRLD